MLDETPSRVLHVPFARYLTPNPTDDYVCRVLRLPDDLKVIAAVNEVLALLLKPEIWEESGLSADDTVDLMANMLIDYWRSDCMLGAIVPFVTSEPPKNGLLCDGSTYARADYPKLYEKLDAAFIVDANSFTVPDLRGQFILGASDTYAAYSTGGEETHQLTVAEMPEHAHTTQPHAHTTQPHAHSETGAVSVLINGGVEAPASAAVPTPMSTGFAGVTVDVANVTVDQSGGNAAHNNMPPYTALKYYIVAR